MQRRSGRHTQIIDGRRMTELTQLRTGLEIAMLRVREMKTFFE